MFSTSFSSFQGIWFFGLRKAPVLDDVKPAACRQDWDQPCWGMVKPLTMASTMQLDHWACMVCHLAMLEVSISWVTFKNHESPLAFPSISFVVAAHNPKDQISRGRPFCVQTATRTHDTHVCLGMFTIVDLDLDPPSIHKNGSKMVYNEKKRVCGYKRRI